jgi:ankyrin repeat protein
MGGDDDVVNVELMWILLNDGGAQIPSGIELNDIDEYSDYTGCTLLHMAATNHHLELVTKLLKARCKINILSSPEENDNTAPTNALGMLGFNWQDKSIGDTFIKVFQLLFAAGERFDIESVSCIRMFDPSCETELSYVAQVKKILTPLSLQDIARNVIRNTCLASNEQEILHYRFAALNALLPETVISFLLYDTTL